MKSSTLHRSNLTKERMSMLENVKFQAQAKRHIDAGQFMRVNKALELDLLYRSLGKNTLRKSVAPSSHGGGGDSKKPSANGVYIGFGFLGGAVFLLIVSIVVWASTAPGNKHSVPDVPKVTPSLEVVSETKDSDTVTQEKYTIKSGDTLNKIAFRFYGKYDAKKIEEIKRINNINSPEGLQIGQVLIIPLGR